MALGIDGACHQAALEAGGKTVAVLAGEVDTPYPRAHTAMYRQISESGLVLSELPPGSSARKWNFVERNRIIAALARLTIVVEAPVDSGALKTSDVALELGRDIGVVLGPIDAPQCAGSNALLRSGAHPIIDVDDALLLAGLTPAPRKGPNIEDATQMRVWEALAKGAASMDELCARSALPVSECLAAVTGLELRGAVECALTGEVRRR
jgi:DNA processing protein